MINAVLTAFQEYPLFFYITASVFGLCVGSFLNVIIYRLPIMMEREFKSHCEDYFNVKCSAQIDKQVDAETFNLMLPPSRCPRCERSIKPYENIPLISYLLMKGRCKGCNTGISAQYPLVELAMGVLSTLLAVYFGPTWLFVATFIFAAALLSMSVIDINHQLLPDVLTIPMLWLGLLLSLTNETNGLLVSSTQAILGAAIGYLTLWGVYHLFKLITGKEGMGFGDFKLLAMLGAWLGVGTLPLIIILSAALGSIIGIALIVIQGRDSAKPLPFGPYLAIAGFVALIWGDTITKNYLSMLG